MTVVAQTKPRQAAWAARPTLQIRRTSTEQDSSNRPLTATLEHPLILNSTLLSKLDMTTFTKQGLLAITQLCSVPLINQNAKRKKPKRRVPAVTNNIESEKLEVPEMLKSQTRLKDAVKGKKLPLIKRGGVDDVFGLTVALPEPCRTCGRPEQPERLHSHPSHIIQSTKSADRAAKPSIRTAINKPVPANFKSAEKLRRERTEDKAVKIIQETSQHDNCARARSGRPRTVTCYLCSREFGTASYPLHEPKCIQKWERENQQLPPELRRKLPEKPSGNVGLAEWNDFAWQAAQAALVPCQKCGRTFNPDRLPIHLRSCKVNGDADCPPTPARQPSESAPSRPPTVPCYICGREFGTRSITIHEPQCLRKWQQENAALPQALQRSEPRKPDIDMSRITGCFICGDQMEVRDRPAHERFCLQSWRRANSARPEGERLPEPERPDYRFNEKGEVDLNGTWHAIWSNHMDSLIPCSHCGRKFFPDRILRHQAACANLPVKSKTVR